MHPGGRSGEWPLQGTVPLPHGCVHPPGAAARSECSGNRPGTIVRMTLETSTGALRPLVRYLRIDLPAGARQPRLWRWVVATVVAVVGSVAACALLARLGPVVFPATAGYGHFRFADYTKLTVLGVLVACAAWPVATWVSSRAARPLFLWAAVAVTIVSFAPDGWILMHGQSPQGVLVLGVMHVAVAAVTYPALVLIAAQPAGTTARGSGRKY